ncbi:MAG: YezD family protein [Nitrosospira sp.]|nr:YezD family protein [Nitrosospira sp.]
MAATTGLESKHTTAEQAARRVPADIKQEILRAVAGIEYGSVEVVIHGGRVVQIECREKIRVGRDELESKATRP